MANAIALALVAAVAALAVRSMWRGRKTGKGSCSCGGDCARCNHCR